MLVEFSGSGGYSRFIFTHLSFQCSQPLPQLSLCLSCITLIGWGELSALAGFRGLIHMWRLLAAWLTDERWARRVWISGRLHDVDVSQAEVALIEELGERIYSLLWLAEGRGHNHKFSLRFLEIFPQTLDLSRQRLRKCSLVGKVLQRERKVQTQVRRLRSVEKTTASSKNNNILSSLAALVSGQRQHFSLSVVFRTRKLHESATNITLNTVILS